MNTTLEQLEINGEVLDMTEYTTKEEMQGVAQESTLLAESAAIKQAIAEATPEVDLSVVAKQGDNQEATNSKILEEVQNKLTPLEAVLIELNHGKQEVVDAIVSKGEYATIDYTLGKLAEVIRNINFVGFDTSGAEFINGLIPKSLSELLANKDGIIRMTDNTTTALTVAGGLSGLQNLEEVSLPNCEYVENLQFKGCPKLEKVSLPKVTQIRSQIFEDDTALREVDLSGLTLITKVNNNTKLVHNCVNLSKLNLDNLSITHATIISGQHNIPNIKLPKLNRIEWNGEEGQGWNYTAFDSNYIQTLELPLLEYHIADNYNNIVISNSLTRLQVGKVTTINAKGINLIDIEIADNCSYNLSFRWLPTAVLDDPEKVAILNENFRKHIVDKLEDRTGKSPLTITFIVAPASWGDCTPTRNALDAETEAAIAAKNWNIAPARTT